MSICKYCNKEAGFLKKKHKECERINEEGKKNILLLFESYLINDENIDNFKNRINIIAENSFISKDEIQITFLEGVKNSITLILSKRIFQLDQLHKLFYLFKENNLKTELEKDDKYNALMSFLTHSLSDQISTMIYEKQILEIENHINDVKNKLDLDNSIVTETLIKTFEKTINNSLEDGIITEIEEEAIVNFRNHFELSQDSLNKNESYVKLVKALVIRDILNGIIPKRVDVTNQTFFNLQKNETLIWLINDVDYYEDRIRRQYVGGYQGASIRIAKGIYYRVGAFKGEPISTVEKIYFGKGILGFTNKHLYFFNYKTSFRVRYEKIVTTNPSSDGFTILKDGATAKQQTFIDGDGWFSYNLITNLSHLDI